MTYEVDFLQIPKKYSCFFVLKMKKNIELIVFLESVRCLASVL